MIQKGHRIGIRLDIVQSKTIHLHEQQYSKATIEFGGRVLYITGELGKNELANSLWEIEQLVNSRISHIRMHVSLEGTD